MRRVFFLLGIALLSFGPAAAAAPPDLTVEVSRTDGGAPLKVTFTAGGEAASYRSDFGDGSTGDGKSVEHTYQAGRWTASLTARSADGDAATKTVSVTAHGLTLTGPERVRYARRTVLRGALIPADAGVLLTVAGPPGVNLQTRTKQDGTFAVRLRVFRPGLYSATLADVASSEPLRVGVVPQLRTGLVGSDARGAQLVFAASVRPKDAGDLDVTIKRNRDVVADDTFRSPVRIKLDTKRLATYRIRVSVQPNEGFTNAVHVLRASVVLPRLVYGARGAAVAQLAASLRELHYATTGATMFDSRLLDAVYAFQKVQGLERTGVVDAAFWRRLVAPRRPVPRYLQPASHIEIDKTHQVLYVVRGGSIALIVPVSTAGLAGRFTPVGRFSIYRKVTGFDPSPLGTLYDPMYFTGGYAIHGNPSVPPYPASHGCVRVPMWIAAHLYETNPYGETVYVY